MSEADNLRQYEDRPGVYEVWYLTWNHPATDQGFWLRYMAKAPTQEPPRGELWFARFDPARPERTFGIQKRFDHVDSARAPFGLTIGGARLGNDHAIGGFDGGGHRVEWNLRWEPRDTLRMYPDLAYRLGIGSTSMMSPNPRVPLTGTVVVDGESLAFDRAVLGQSHVWGTQHAYTWTWARCADFPGAPDGHLELIAARLKRRSVLTPPLVMVTLTLDGEHHHLNQFRHLARNRCTWGGQQIAFSAWSPRVKLEGEMSAPPERFVSALYEDPDGKHLYCANTEIGDARVTVYKRAGLGWREYRRLEAPHRAHFELGGRTRDPAVVHEHVLV
jgi:hypothetical protein